MMLPTCILAVYVVLLVFSAVLNFYFGLWCMRLCRQRDVLHADFNRPPYEKLPDDLIHVLDQIEGVKSKKTEKEERD